MLDGEPRPRAAEARHHLVGDEEDPVAVAERPDPFEVAVGRYEDSVRSGDRLEDERRDGRGALELDRFLEGGKNHVGRVGRPGRAVVEVEHVDDARDAGLVRPAAGVTRERDGADRRPVV